MKFVTFNLRTDTAHDGQNAFFFRAGWVLRKIDRELPDVIGFQEVRPHMLDFLRKHLPDYTFVGCGRGADFGDEHNPIAFLKERYELISLDTQWLSPTPRIPGSRFEDQSVCPRVVTHVTLRPWNSTRLFRVFNTHLDHISDSARVLGAQAVCRVMEQQQALQTAPMVLMGDFNACPGDAPVRIFAENRALGLTEHTGNIQNSWHDYGRKRDIPHIDYIFSAGFAQKGPAAAWESGQEGAYLSDHDPLEVNMEME